MGRQQTVQSSMSDCSASEVSICNGKVSPQWGQTTSTRITSSILGVTFNRKHFNSKKQLRSCKPRIPVCPDRRSTDSKLEWFHDRSALGMANVVAEIMRRSDTAATESVGEDVVFLIPCKAGDWQPPLTFGGGQRQIPTNQRAASVFARSDAASLSSFNLRK